MRRRLLTLTALPAVLTIGVAGVSSADVGGTPSTFEQVRQGGGSASANAEAGATGALSGEASSTGGDVDLVRGLLGLVLPVSGPARGLANATVEQSRQLDPGRYEVVVTFSGASGEEDVTGAGTAIASVGFAVPDPFAIEPGVLRAGDIAELPSSPGTVVVSGELQIDQPGTYSVVANVLAQTIATGAGNAASAEASSDQVDIEVTKIS